MLPHDRSRAFGLMLWIAVALYALLHINGVWLLLTYEEIDPLMVFETSGVVGFLPSVFPRAAAVPGGGLFLTDWNSGYCDFVLPRSGKRRYLTSKLLATALSGALTLAGGMLVFLAVVLIRYPQNTQTEPSFMALTGLAELLAGGGVWAYFRYYAARVLLQALAGGFFAVSALCFSAFCPNLSLTLCAPLLLGRLLAELGTLTGLPNFFNPAMLESGDTGLSAAGTLWGALAVYALSTGLMAAIFYLRAGRRLGKNG